MKSFVTTTVTVILVAACLYMPPAVYANQDHQAGEMLAPPAEVTTRAKMLEEGEARSTRTMSREEVLERFRSAHPEGMRMAFYYNRRFADHVSDWVATERFVIGSAGRQSEQGAGGETRKQGSGNVAAQSERRRARDSSTRAPATQLRSAYVAAMRNVGVRLVEPGIMMRLADASQEDGTFTRSAPDHQRLEVRALSEYADVLTELRVVSAPSAEQPRFEMRVIRVSDGALLAVLETDGIPPEQDYPFQWVATESGFERDRPPLTLAQLGTELALITMQELLDAPAE